MPSAECFLHQPHIVVRANTKEELERKKKEHDKKYHEAPEMYFEFNAFRAMGNIQRRKQGETVL